MRISLAKCCKDEEHCCSGKIYHVDIETHLREFVFLLDDNPKPTDSDRELVKDGPSSKYVDGASTCHRVGAVAFDDFARQIEVREPVDNRA